MKGNLIKVIFYLSILLNIIFALHIVTKRLKKNNENATEENAISDKKYIYHNAKNLSLSGQLSEADGYNRIPEKYKGKVSKEIWDLSTHSSGINVQFKTNSPSIRVRWELKSFKQYPHIAATAASGVDLYCLKNGAYQFLGVGKPTGLTNNQIIASNLDTTNKKFILYLPLYNELANVEIGIEDGYQISKSQIKGKPIVAYGTSITQGASASRPGMAYPSILSRKLNTEVINLGFSGNGFFQKEIAEIFMVENPSRIILDCTPNSHPDTIKKNLPELLDFIRSKDQGVHVIIVESITREDSYFNSKKLKLIKRQNFVLDSIFEERGDRLLSIVKSDSLIGHDHEGTVDGTHLTDLGFYRYSEQILKIMNLK